MSEIQNIFIANDTPYPKAATIRIIDKPKGVLLINAGTCIKRSFYDEIATFFCSQGYITVQFDYVGVGDSRPENLKKVNRSIYDWGAKDMQAVSDWIDCNYTGLDKSILGHSMGGQIVGLMQSVNSFKKIITVASSYGNIQNFDQPIRRIGMKIAARSLFPLLNRLYGYFPANLLGMGMDWPYGVAEDWRLWNSKYLSLKEWMDLQQKIHYFEGLKVPMTSYLLADDMMATSNCIPHFLIDYPDTSINMIAPKDYGLKELGHFKTFRKQALPFWKVLLAALESQ